MLPGRTSDGEAHTGVEEQNTMTSGIAILTTSTEQGDHMKAVYTYLESRVSGLAVPRKGR